MIIYNTYSVLENKEKVYVYVAQTNKLFEIAPVIKEILLDKPSTNIEIQKIINKYNINLTADQVIEELGRMALISCNKKEKRNINLDKIVVSEMTLLITQQCNLRCSYCFGEGGEYNNKGIMSDVIAKKSVDFLYEHSGNKKDITILFFGGEPLINFEIIKQVVEHCKDKDEEYKKTCHYSITTNGTITNDEITQFLVENKFLVQISIDGTEKVTNANRYDLNRKGAYSKIVEGAKVLQNKVIVGARGTITPAGLNVGDNAKHLLNEGFAYVHLAPANNVLGEADIENLISYYEKYCKDFEQLLMDGKYKECISRHNLYGILREIHEGGIRNVYCAAGFKAISVDIMGNIYPCHRFVGNEEFCMGSVITGVFSQDYMLEQLCMIPHKCSECICQAVCTGGCSHDNLIVMGNINIPAQCNCKIQEFLTKWALNVYISMTRADKKVLFGKD